MIELNKLAIQSNQNKVQSHFEEFNQTLRDQLAVIPITYLRLSIQAIIVVLAVLVGLTTPLLVASLEHLFFIL